MFTKADILARLQNGETVDTIAAEMANALNEAEAEKKALDAELAAKEKEETRVLEAKRIAVQGMLENLGDFLVVAGEEELLDELKEIEIDKVVELLDGTIEMVKSLEKLKELQFPLAELHKAATINPRVQKIVVNEDSADKVIADFLKNFGL